MAKDISLLQLNHSTMQQVQITPADRTSRDLQDDISVFHDAGLWNLVCIA
jgi:hypothetical protein